MNNQPPPVIGPVMKLVLLLMLLVGLPACVPTSSLNQAITPPATQNAWLVYTPAPGAQGTIAPTLSTSDPTIFDPVYSPTPATIAPTVTLNPDGRVPFDNSNSLYTRVPSLRDAVGGGTRVTNCTAGKCPTRIISSTLTITTTTTTTPTTPVPTFIPPPSQAPRFPETPEQPFDAAVFVFHLEQVRDSFRSFVDGWIPILEGTRERNRGDCGSFLGWYNLWVTEAPAFTNVPSEWQGLYYEYRVKLNDAVFVTSQIQRQCPWVEPGDDIDPQSDPVSFFNQAYPRLEVMVQTALLLAP